MLSIAMGFLIGMYVGYTQEDEINDLCHQSKKTKKKIKRNYHKVMDQICDYMDFD